MMTMEVYGVKGKHPLKKHPHAFVGTCTQNMTTLTVSMFKSLNLDTVLMYFIRNLCVWEGRIYQRLLNIIARKDY